MHNTDTRSLVQNITNTVADSRCFQEKHHSDLPITVQVIEILISDLEAAVERQHANAMLEGYRGLQEVLAAPKRKELFSGKCQVVKAFTQDEALTQCPWAKSVLKAGQLKYQENKWVCFESDNDADYYRLHF
jgi:hypothetical protein